MSEQKAVATWQEGERKVTITFDDVKKHLCPKASDQEVYMFLKLCQSESLNPFTRECWLIKYKEDEPAAMVIATVAFLKAAERSENYDGQESGIIVRSKGEVSFREGTLLLEGEELFGGWASVYRKDRRKPFYAAVNLTEYRKLTRQGEPTRFWKDMPGTMIRKVALSHALREAFPTRFGGTYTTVEVPEEEFAKALPQGPGQLPEVVAEAVPEQPQVPEVPVAFEKNGAPDWSHFWAKLKEIGIDDVKAHEILQVGSIKNDWLGKGHTLEDAFRVIEQAVKYRAEAERKKRGRDPKSLLTLPDLFKALEEDFGLGEKEVLGILNVASRLQLNKPASVLYREVADFVAKR